MVDKRLIKDDYVLRNLYREATILAKLHHPNIIKVSCEKENLFRIS